MKHTLVVASVLAAWLLPVRASALENEELLALVAMPLAVAAVSEVTDVRVSELIDVVTLLNDAAVPPAQFIEVVRYAPAAMIVETQSPSFTEYIRLRQGEGLRGTALVTSIEQRMDVYDLGHINLDVERPRVIDVNDDFVPAIVHTRLAAARAGHPHGGPPGQLKKAAGVQTGAEIVHGSARPKRVAVHADDDKDGNRGRAKQTVRSGKPGRGNSGRVAERGGKGGNGKGKGKGKGNG